MAITTLWVYWTDNQCNCTKTKIFISFLCMENGSEKNLLISLIFDVFIYLDLISNFSKFFMAQKLKSFKFLLHCKTSVARNVRRNQIFPMFQQWFSEDNRKHSHNNNNNISISCDMASLRNCILFCCIYRTVSFSLHNKSFAQKSFAIISLKTKIEKCHSFTKIQLKCFA